MNPKTILLACIVGAAMWILAASFILAGEAPQQAQPTLGELQEKSKRLQAEMNNYQLQANMANSLLNELPGKFDAAKAEKEKVDAEIKAKELPAKGK